MYMRRFNTNKDSLFPEIFFFFFFEKNIIPVLKLLPLKLFHSLQNVENQFGQIWKEW